jgi:two-component system, NarL family, nitrate/nitrite response regulator NarL
MGAGAGQGPAVLIVEHQGLLSDALALALRQHGLARVGATPQGSSGADSVLAYVAARRPDVVLLDVPQSHDGAHMGLIRRLRQERVCVLVLTTARTTRFLGLCLEAGAAGVFDKSQSLDDLVHCIVDAAEGRAMISIDARAKLIAAAHGAPGDHEDGFSALTTREREVLRHLIDGHPSDRIAEESHVAVSTVRSQVKSIFQKLGVNSRLAAVALAHEKGWHSQGDAADESSSARE